MSDCEDEVFLTENFLQSLLNGLVTVFLQM